MGKFYGEFEVLLQLIEWVEGPLGPLVEGLIDVNAIHPNHKELLQYLESSKEASALAPKDLQDSIEFGKQWFPKIPLALDKAQFTGGFAPKHAVEER